ncbi:MAG: alpha/beta fold hydrolase [Paracoccaceae bacterium]
MTGAATPEVIAAGEAGPAALLIHSSASSGRQWKHLSAALEGTHRVRAVNMFGYGGSPAWEGARRQTLADQSALARAALPEGDGPVAVVGHSFGGAVAMQVAADLGPRAARLVLIEPNPFYLLALAGHAEAHAEAMALGAVIRRAGRDGSWRHAAQVFADYWNGPGTWDAMPEARQAGFAGVLRPNLHEWDAVEFETTPLADWAERLPAATTLIWAADTVRPIAEICGLLRAGNPGWDCHELPGGGHMVPVTAPETVTPLVLRALQDIGESA